MRKLTLPSTLLLAAMTLALTSCSRNPVAPETSSTPSLQPGSGSMGATVVPDEPGQQGGGTPNSTQMMLTVGEEGVIVAGRFTLWVRKNSLRQDATIKLTVSDPEAMEAQMEVFPPEANNFQSPVVVSANLSDVPNVDYNVEQMFYWDGAWESVADQSAHPNQENVVAHLVTIGACRVGPGDGGGKGGHKFQ